MKNSILLRARVSRFPSLRRFIVIWSGAIGLAFLLLGCDAVLTLHHLDDTARDEMRHAARLQLSQNFEVAALEANRRPAANWSHADGELRQLQTQVAPADFTPIETAYRNLKIEFAVAAPWNDERPFLDALRSYRHDEFTRATADNVRSARLESFSRGAILILLALALTGLVAGGIELWTRVFGPLLRISRAAKRFGEGELGARVEIERADEIGELAATWNDMAGAIEAREAERLRFVAALAHDLKNPLMVVGMAATMMREKPGKFTPEQRDDWLEKIARNARRMEAMIADLTNAVQSQTGALQLQIAPLDLAKLARDCADEIWLAYPDHPIEFTEVSSLEINGDRARLERVIANLLSNAAKYSASQTEIIVDLKSDKNHAILSVTDQGAGISPDDLKRLFTPFVRLERTEKMASGTGLGLATTKKIIEAHGGKLEVESEVGVGSTFRVILSVAGA